MFERFTASARESVIRAQEIAHERGDRAITARHLALALCEYADLAPVLAEHGWPKPALERPAGGGLADDDEDALRSLGIDPDALRAAAERTFGDGALDREPPSPRRWPWTRKRARHLPFSTAAKSALESSLQEAIRLHSKEIRAEHLALGLVRTRTAELPALGASGPALAAALEARLRRAA